MLDLSKKRIRYLGICQNYSQLYRYSDDKEQQIVSSGVLNFIWNSWNNFWREYWICHISGGIDFSRNKITGIYPEYNDKQCCHFLLFKIGKKKNHNYGDSINGSYQEATWGDPQVIQKIAFELIPTYPQMTTLLGVLSSYQTEIEHFQKIRNSFIHLNKDNVDGLSTISGYYIFNTSQRLIDILESQSSISGSRCFEHLNENMKGLLLNI
ncbi:hypothetical protein ACIGCP_18425 [Cellulophaga baltica]|uniref:hypothetical protein n=1 Tax=Cellulophaga baltica TaxID=76594 RepID=UPI0037C55246